MAKLSPRVVESMARIECNEKPFMDHLDSRIAALQEDIMFQPDEVQLRILQGRAQELNDLRKAIKLAPELCRKA